MNIYSMAAMLSLTLLGLCLPLNTVTYSRQELLNIRDSLGTIISTNQLIYDNNQQSHKEPICRRIRRRGKRGGVAWRRRQCLGQWEEQHRSTTFNLNSTTTSESYTIPVITNRRQQILATVKDQCTKQKRILIPIPRTLQQTSNSNPTIDIACPPSIYLINPTSLAKPHAFEQLTADLSLWPIDTVLVTETWFKKHHNDKFTTLTDYITYRNDRKNRKGGGVAIFVKSSITSSYYELPDNITRDEHFETIWIKLSKSNMDYFICCIYHPPNPVYSTQDLIQYLLNCIDYIETNNDNAIIIIGGDFNKLPDNELLTRGLLSIVNQPTHQGHCLDKIFTSRFIYSNVKTMSSNIKTAHKAVIAMNSDTNIVDFNKTHNRFTIRKRSVKQFIDLTNELRFYNWNSITNNLDCELAFNQFYVIINDVLNRTFPEQYVTVTSRDPFYITPYIKKLLRDKNRLVRAGKEGAANSLATKINKLITEKTSTFLGNSNIENSTDMWQKVNSISGKERQAQNYSSCPNITAESLNKHYSNISQDPQYVKPTRKTTCVNNPIYYSNISVFSVFSALDKLKPTAPGFDQLPYWFLKAAAPFIAEPLAHLFTISFQNGYVPQQWKTAIISPIPKVPQPNKEAEFRPISLTPILSRIFEKFVVRRDFYPLLSRSINVSLFSDQFAFRPTGSTTSALIYLLNTVTNLLVDNPYVHIIALDFSKAFDSLGHPQLLSTLTSLGLGDSAYNWLVNFLSDRGHVTKFRGQKSNFLPITASVVQGSAVGPFCFIATATGLRPIHAHNEMSKYADDCYLIVPANNTPTITSELQHINSWASQNNLKLNVNKTQELIVYSSSHKKKNPPAILPDITRVNNLNILGVTVDDLLSFRDHITTKLSQGHQQIYALKTLKAHGLAGQNLNNVCKAVFLPTLTYASQAWWGFISEEDKKKMTSLVNKTRTWNIDGGIPLPNIYEICAKHDHTLFTNIITNSNHVLNKLLPEIKITKYNLRDRNHNRVLPLCTALTAKNFINRMLFSYKTINEFK